MPAERSCADLVSTASRSSPRRRAIAFTTLKVERVECELTGHSNRSVLSVNEEVARSGLSRFAAFGPPTRTFIENVKKRQAACSAACPLNCAGEICKPRSGVKTSPQPANARKKYRVGRRSAHRPHCRFRAVSPDLRRLREGAVLTASQSRRAVSSSSTASLRPSFPVRRQSRQSDHR